MGLTEGTAKEPKPPPAFPPFLLSNNNAFVEFPLHFSNQRQGVSIDRRQGSWVSRYFDLASARTCFPKRV